MNLLNNLHFPTKHESILIVISKLVGCKLYHIHIEIILHNWR